VDLTTTLRAYTEIKQGDYVVFEIEDNGKGISDDDMHKLFEPFYTSKDMGSSGSGLGLSVVWGVVKDHNAYIDVTTALGSGTKFSIYFPTTEESVSTDDELVADISGTESILIVDDLDSQRQTFEKVLSPQGYHLDSVKNGRLAVEFLKQNEVDLVLLDMILEEGFDGLDTYREIKKVKNDQKVIIVSGFSKDKRVKEAMKLGVGAYIRKPFTIIKLGTAIRQELDKK